MDTCKRCGGKRMRWHPGVKPHRADPGEVAAWECWDCGEHYPETKLEALEATADDDRDWRLGQ